jgi:hypothetical protein
MRAAALAMTLVMLAGCGTSSVRYTIDGSELKEMSGEGRRWIYDAENEVVVALDKLDDAREELQQVQHSLDASKGSDDEPPRKASEGPAWQQLRRAWIDYLSSRKTAAEARVELYELGLVVARATVELAKAQVIVREDLLAGRGFNPARFERQEKELRKVYLDRFKEVDALRKKTRESEQRWWKARASFAGKSGDYDSGLWIK